MSMSAMLLGCAMLAPNAAPVPADAPPDPLARGYLGATFDTTSANSELTISTVTAGHPAAKAGLKPGDEVVRVGALEPKSFNQLVAHICSFRPGATVEIEVKRNNERKVVLVTLIARPSSADPPPVTNPMPFGPEKP